MLTFTKSLCFARANFSKTQNQNSELRIPFVCLLVASISGKLSIFEYDRDHKIARSLIEKRAMWHTTFRSQFARIIYSPYVTSLYERAIVIETSNHTTCERDQSSNRNCYRVPYCNGGSFGLERYSRDFSTVIAKILLLQKLSSTRYRKSLLRKLFSTRLSKIPYCKKFLRQRWKSTA